MSPRRIGVGDMTVTVPWTLSAGMKLIPVISPTVFRTSRTSTPSKLMVTISSAMPGSWSNGILTSEPVADGNAGGVEPANSAACVNTVCSNGVRGGCAGGIREARFSPAFGAAVVTVSRFAGLVAATEVLSCRPCSGVTCVGPDGTAGAPASACFVRLNRELN